MCQTGQYRHSYAQDTNRHSSPCEEGEGQLENGDLNVFFLACVYYYILMVCTHTHLRNGRYCEGKLTSKIIFNEIHYLWNSREEGQTTICTTYSISFTVQGQTSIHQKWEQMYISLKEEEDPVFTRPVFCQMCKSRWNKLFKAILSPGPVTLL